MHRFTLFIVATSLAAPHSLALAQRTITKPHATSSIEGDVYYVTQSGDTKRGAGRTIFLLKDQGLRDAIRERCASSLERQIQLQQWSMALLDTEARVRSGKLNLDVYDVLGREARIKKGIDAIERETRDSTLTTIAHAIVDSAGTGMNAHYRFTAVRSGAYVAFSEWTVGDHHYLWWAPITVRTGDTKRDLDNSVLLEPATLCLGR